MSVTPWHLLLSGPGAPDFNMSLDEALLLSVANLGAPVLRFYAWTEPAATFGYSQKYNEIAAATRLRPLIRRPTGGGLVPHDADWTYSLAVPPGHEWYALKAIESYRRIHEWIRDAFTSLGLETTLSPIQRKEIPGQCFAGAEKSDLLWHGRKIAGAAQRRTRAGLLIQGSVQPPPIPLQRIQWEQAMQAVGSAQQSIPWQPLSLSPALLDLVSQLRHSKYGAPAFNQRR